MGLFSKTETTASFEYEGHLIEIQNWYRFLPTGSEMTVSVDGKILDRSRKLSQLNPDEPVVRLTDVSPSIQSLDIFVIGAMTIKFAANVNGETVYRDEISSADALQKKFFGDKLV